MFCIILLAMDIILYLTKYVVNKILYEYDTKVTYKYQKHVFVLQKHVLTIFSKVWDQNIIEST